MTINDNGDSSVSENNTDTNLTSNNTNEASQSSSQNTDANQSTQSSSAVERRDDKAAMLSVVTDALDRTRKEESSTSEHKVEGDPKDILDPNAPKDETQPGKENTEEDKRFDKHPRFQKLLAENRKLKEETEKITGDAKSYQAVKSYMSDQNLVEPEVQKGMHIMALMKNNPSEALKALTPYIKALQMHVGEILPPDLQQKLDEGMIDLPSARETARMRNENNLLEAKRQIALRAQQEVQQRNASSAAMINQVNFVTSLESKVRASDPDYDVKRDFVMRAAQDILGNNTNATPEQLTAAYNKALGFVNQQFQKVKPRSMTPTAPLHSSVSSATRNAAPQPKNKYDVVDLALRKTNS